MSDLIAIVGESGTGKSTSISGNKFLNIKGLNHKETFIINIVGKPLPFKGFKKKYTSFKDDPKTGNYYATNNSAKIVECMQFISENRRDIKNVIVDD